MRKKSTFQSRADAVKHNRGFKGVLKTALYTLAAAAGCGGTDIVLPPIGFGDDEIGARDYITSILDEYSYTYVEDENAQFRNRDDGTYFDNNYDVFATGPFGEEVYVEYDSSADGLTPEAAAGIESRQGTAPALIRIDPADSEETIRQKLEDIL